MIGWDFLPEDWTTEEGYFLRNQWYETDCMRAGKVKEAYQYVTENFDKTLAEHGYVREGEMYRAVRAHSLMFFAEARVLFLADKGLPLFNLRNISAF